MFNLFNNPELKRYIWIELTQARLILMPSLLSAIYLIIYLSSSNYTSFVEVAGIFSLTVFSFSSFLWGLKLASESVIAEVNERTWDNQRLTLVDPFSMSIGKLFGSTIYTWYGALFTLSFYSYSMLQKTSIENVLIFLASLLLSTVFAHSVVISSSIIGISKNRNKAKINSVPHFTLGLVLIFLLPFYFVRSSLYTQEVSSVVHWFDFYIDIKYFLLGSIFFFSIWSFVSLYRNIRLEFQYTNSPIVWTLFLFTIGIYIVGFESNMKNLSDTPLYTTFLYTYFIILYLVTYYMVLAEPKYIINLKFIYDKFLNKNYKDFFDHSPLWLISFLFLVVFGIGLSVDIMFQSGFHLKSENKTLPFIFPLLVVLYALRDICIILFSNLSSKYNRGDIASIVYLFILYVILPGIFKFIIHERVFEVFYPLPIQYPSLSTISILIQLVIIGTMTYKKFQEEIAKV